MIISSQSYIWNVLSLDEGTYLSVAMLMNKGWVVYRDVFESKPPLFHFINLFIYTLVGNRIHAARFFSIGAAALSAYILYEIVGLHYKEKTAITAAVIFSLASSLPVFDGFRVLTEPFSTLFMVSIIYVNELFSRNKDPRFLPLIGFFGSAYTLIRPTGILFTGIVVLLAFLRWKTITTPREIGYIGLGGLAIPLVFVFYFLSKGALGQVVFWILEPAQGFTEYVVTNITAKLQWLIQVAKSILPLIVLSLPGLGYRDKELHDLNYAWIMFLPTLFLVSFLPGFPHYYYEILPALSIQAALGTQIGFKLFQSAKPKLKTGFILLLVFSVGVSLLESRTFYINYREATDFPLAIKVSYDVREQTMPDDSIFIYETAWPKLGPSIYYLSERAPPIHNLFFFPWKMSDLEYQRIINTIDSRESELVVLIGPDPSIIEVISITEHVLDNYVLIEQYDDNTGIYPHIEEDLIHVRIYKRRTD